MIYEFEGKTEREAIEEAANQLGLETDEFDVEIVENQAGSLFKKGKVRIRVHTRDSEEAHDLANVSAGNSYEPDLQSSADRTEEGWAQESRESQESREPLVPNDEFELKMIEWVKTVVEKMGYPAKVSVLFREDKKIGLRIETDNTAMIIGKKGKNIDALQLLANVYAGKLGREDMKIILDSENYRIRREELLVRMAYESAEQVRKTGHSVLLEPMNPFERRIIHTRSMTLSILKPRVKAKGSISK